MIQVRVDEATAELLRSLKEKAELITREGMVLGYFTPISIADEE